MHLLTKDKHASFSTHPSAHSSRWDHDVVPLGLRDETALTRRQSAQHHSLANSADQAFKGLPDARSLIEKRRRRAEKQRKRVAAQKEAANAAESDSSTSTSSSGSESSASEE